MLVLLKRHAFIAGIDPNFTSQRRFGVASTEVHVVEAERVEVFDQLDACAPRIEEGPRAMDVDDWTPEKLSRSGTFSARGFAPERVKSS